MAVVGNLVVGLSVNTGPFAKGMKQAAGALGGVGAAANKAAGAISSVAVGMGAALAGVAAGGAALAAGWISAASSASDLNESTSKTEAILGGASKAVIKFADEYADRYGSVKKETLDAASAIGALGQELGGLSGKDLSDFSIQFTKLAYDLSSIANIDMKEATSALQIGLSGNQSDMLKNFGAVLTEDTLKAYAYANGLAKVGKTLTESQKLAARAGIITEKLAKVQGDLERTSGGAANQTRSLSGRLENLKADAGTAIQPLTDQVLSLANGGMKVLADQFAANTEAIAQWASAADSGGSVVNTMFMGLGNAVGFFADALQVLSGLWHGVQAAFTKGLQIVIDLAYATIKPFTMLLDLLPGIDGAFANFEKAFNDEMSRRAAADWGEAINKTAGELPSNKIHSFFEKVTAESSKASKAMAEAAEKAKGIGKGIASSNPAITEFTKKIMDLEKDLRTQIDMFGKSSEEAAIYKLSLDGASASELANATALSKQLVAMEKAKDGLTQQASAAKQYFEDTRTPLEEYERELKRINQVFGNGLIDTTTRDRAMKKAKSDFEDKSHPGNRFASAMVLGSQEARSTVLSYRGVDQPSDPAKEAAKNGRIQIDLQKKMIELLARIAGAAKSPSTDLSSALEGFSFQ